MTLVQNLITWLGTLIVFLGIDFLWIGLIANGFYKEEMKTLLRFKADGGLDVLWGPALLLYAIMIAGLVVFVLPKANGNLIHGFLYGAFFGVVLYATYDLTSYALIRDWTLKLTVVDMLWGAVICGLSSLAMVQLAKWVA